jgi:glutathione synthase/RimK-type ligase-like ATP-grasp enzyme
MRRCAFLTTDDLHGFVSDDELAYGPLERLGWQVESVPWRTANVDWGGYQAVAIRTTWDYQKSPEEFLAVLERIERSGARIENSLDLVRWNIDKSYLRDLEARGVPIVPTVWGSELGPLSERAVLERLNANEIVVKPLIGANADMTYRLTRGSPGWREAAAALNSRGYLAQPFLRSVVTEGEYSLIYFDGGFSHALLKTPRTGDFRVQEEHGATIRAVAASAPLQAAGARALAALARVPLYARVDLVRIGKDAFAVMEFELIEPSLYLRMDEGAAERFGRAIHRRFDAGAACRVAGR